MLTALKHSLISKTAIMLTISFLFYALFSNILWNKMLYLSIVATYIRIPFWPAGRRSTVGNVSGYRCVSDCRSRGRKFDPGPVPYFRGDWSWNDFYGHSPPSADSFKKGCCQLQAKVCARITGWTLVQACPGKSVVRWPDRPAMTIVVDLGCKATKTNKTKPFWPHY